MKNDPFDKKRANDTLRSLKSLKEGFADVGYFTSSTRSPSDAPTYTAVRFMSNNTESGTFSSEQVDDVVEKLKKAIVDLGLSYKIRVSPHNYSADIDADIDKAMSLGEFVDENSYAFPSNVTETHPEIPVVERSFLEIIPQTNS